jgi:hypothetical protein
MNIIEIIAAWNKQSDYMNKWDSLGEDEKLEWAMQLEREACCAIVYGLCESDNAAQRIVDAIRARGTT